MPFAVLSQEQVKGRARGVTTPEGWEGRGAEDTDPAGTAETTQNLSLGGD